MMKVPNPNESPAVSERKGSRLTSRQRQVLALLVKGSTTQQIADMLGLSFHTVTTHTRKIYRKLGIKNRSSLVVTALTEGLLEEPEPIGFRNNPLDLPKNTNQ